jgi:hypothetical protein
VETEETKITKLLKGTNIKVAFHRQNTIHNAQRPHAHTQINTTEVAFKK